ncbi:hypothetical protein [Planomicrobium sp. CPCC 101079]|uniref:hypothetical protein n=1 Tax=Planomicrobium sp. CPCC 101079 TaxID=2599618 RepID=UPI001647FEAB|nr:hypothetical protein [Planomicrobium sp. CPCC 101079]
MEVFLELLFVYLPLILGAFVLRGLRIIQLNSAKQVEQNKEIIALLKSGAAIKEEA